MKFSLAITSVFAGMAVAAPTFEAAPLTEVSLGDALEARQLGRNTRNDLQNGGACPQAILIFARGSGESGNLGILGGPVGSGIESSLGRGNVWVQGVGGAYRATIGDNVLPDGTSRAAIREMTEMFQLADSTCPDATIVAGGYSQGAALAAATIRDLDAGIRDKIAGVVLFGYTKNQQNNGQIPNYPADDVEVFCNRGDLVCTGSLIVAAPHLTYQSDARGPAPAFLVSKINAA